MYLSIVFFVHHVIFPISLESFYQCSVGHFFCSSCHDKLPGNKCQLCSGCALGRSHGMERAIRSILMDCCYAKQGCTEKTTYYDKGDHEAECPHALCFCPVPGCGFAGSREGLLHHLTGVHKWPLTTFGQYQVPFNLRIIQPGAQVLRCMNDGQLFLVSARQAAAPPRLTVSLVCVRPYHKPTGFGCTVSFSCFSRHRSTWTLDGLPPLRLSDWAPKEYMCVVPKALDGADGDGAVLTITIVCGEDDDDDDEYGYEDEDYLDDDISDTESDEDDSDS